MKRPQMIIFDYGHTLYDEEKFDVRAGDRAIIDIATANPEGITGDDLANKALEMNDYIGRYHKGKERDYLIEVHNLSFARYLYEYFNLSFHHDLNELEYVFWQNAAPGKATKDINTLLAFLKEEGIRTGVISNLSFSGKTLKRRLSQEINISQFEFILSTADYLFRKPSPFIFQMALKKAGLNPDQVWYCGDNVYCDVEGATEVGIQPVWYTGANETGVYNGKPDVEVVPEKPSSDHLHFDDWLDMIDYLRTL